MGSALDEEALRVIRAQLGREPHGVLGIERRCRWGYPQVIKVYSLFMREGSKIEPFPTLFWLTCPFLIEQLSDLEGRGYIKELERLIAEDGGLREEYRRDHRDYLAERWATLSPEDWALAERLGLARALRERGIGGIADWDKVKCLHLHYAHHLARGSAIGRWIEKHFALEECPASQVRCAGL
ncbi:MAG: DUF501 domain-containing protein [Candidatus Acetothermia bacterium]|nr:DUF501 domain-containing protein [Candidatus Acetothermia bacterium]